MPSGGIIDVWLTANQWDVVLEAMSQRRTKQAQKVAERIFKSLSGSPGYQRHWVMKDDRLAALIDGSNPPSASAGGSGPPATGPANAGLVQPGGLRPNDGSPDTERKS